MPVATVLALVVAFDIMSAPQSYQLPYLNEVLVIEMPFHEIDAVCRTYDTNRDYSTKRPGSIYSCARVRPDRCTIIIPLVDIDHVTKPMRNAMESHEMAHCLGWHHDNE